MPGGAPTPPTQVRPSMMMVQHGGPMGSQNTSQYDGQHPAFQQIVGPSGSINGTGPPQRQPSLSEANSYMIPGQMIGQGQQMPPYMAGQVNQQRAPQPLGFGSSVQMMSGGPVNSTMIGPGSTQQQHQMVSNSQPGMMVNGPMMQPIRPNGPPPVSSAQSQGMIVPQSPGLMSVVCSIPYDTVFVRKFHIML